MKVEQVREAAEYWRYRFETARKMLLECRAEFCWLGNTGKMLHADVFAKLVDEIDAVIDGNGESDNAP